MNSFGKVSEIRCGKFYLQLAYIDMRSQVITLNPPGEAPVLDPSYQMQILLTGWLGSDYLPFFHSLN